MRKKRKRVDAENFPVVILAGGLGTRLGSLTAGRPKALVPVAGKPFLFHQLELLRRKGLSHVILSVGYKAALIKRAVKAAKISGMRIEFVEDGPVPLGTGGAVRKAAQLVDGPFFVLYGDSYLEINYLAVAQAYKKSGKKGLMTVYRNNNRLDKSNLIFRRGLIKRYSKNEVTPQMRHIDYGLTIINKEQLKSFPAHRKFDLSAIFQKLIKKNEMAAVEVKKRFYEVGSPSGIQALEVHLARKRRCPIPKIS